MGEFEDIVEQIAEAGLLTQKQAIAYLGREIDMTGRHQIASYLDCAPNTVDNHRRSAVDKVEAARDTLQLIEQYEDERYPEPPDNCDDCGDRIHQQWVQTDEGMTLCEDCADI